MCYNIECDHFLLFASMQKLARLYANTRENAASRASCRPSHPGISRRPHLVATDHAFCFARVQHLLIPLDQSLGVWDLLLHGVAVEDVVVTLDGGTCPDVSGQEPARRGRYFVTPLGNFSHLHCYCTDTRRMSQVHVQGFIQNFMLGGDTFLG